MEDCIRSYPKVDKQNILDKLFSRNVYFFLLIVKRAKSCKVTLRCSFLVIFFTFEVLLLAAQSGKWVWVWWLPGEVINSEVGAGPHT